jgi:outer membrane protein
MMRANVALLILMASAGAWPSCAAAKPRSKVRRSTPAEAAKPADGRLEREDEDLLPSRSPASGQRPQPEAAPEPIAPVRLGWSAQPATSIEPKLDAALVRPLKVTYEGPAEDGGGHRWLEGFRFRLGALYVAPTGKGREVQMTNMTGMAKLSLKEGPIAGSTSSLGATLLPALIVGYALPFLDRQLSIETILAPPITQKMTLGGTIATTSIAPTALGSLPTGVPPLGTELGEVKTLPPIVTAVYRFFPRARLRPYLGAGACALFVLDAKITNVVMTAVRPPKVSIPTRFGWVAQAGADVRFGLDALWPGRSFYLTADVKYVGGLDTTTTVRDIWVELPDLPLYGAAKVGDAVARLSVDPLVTFLGVGMDL